MKIGMLGPLSISHEDTRGGHEDTGLRVAAAKHRSLLAALAVRAGDVVPTGALAEAVWDGRLPASWECTLRNYVRRLRRDLGDCAWLLVSVPPGYLLRVGRDDIDVLRFETLVKAAQEAARGRDWDQAARTLTAALGLWRGTAFADIQSQRIRDDHTPYLEELRLTALELRIEADLRRSPARAADAVPELRRLSGQHPAREDIHGLLMLALYRGGRQAEALTVYREARRYCVQELGTEPGPGLHDLHQRILRSDPGVWAP